MNIPASPTLSLATMPGIANGVASPQPDELRALGAAFLAGIGSGHRSMLPLAVQSWQTPQRGLLARVLVTVLAAGELFGDKLPIAPDRRMPLALVGRAVTGGLVALGAAPRGRTRVANVAVGSAAAILATYAGARLRRQLGRRMPAVVAALVEDALTLGLSLVAARLARPSRAPIESRS